MGGFTGRFVGIETSYDSDQSNNMNIEYLAIGFPIKKWLKLSAGLVPYSRIQYAFSATYDSVSTGEYHTFDYTGFGGFNEFYIGAAITIKDVFSIGANLNYLFGSLDRSKSSYLTNLQSYSAKIENTQNLIASDFYTKLGLQYHPTINEKHKIIIGLTLDAKANIDVKLKNQTTRYNTSESTIYQDSLIYSLDTLTPMIIPNKIGIGLSYTYNDIITITGEYTRQDWSGTKIEASDFKPGLYESIRFGVEYNPAPLSKKTRESYFKRIKYRIGGYYTKTYLYHTTGNISDMGLTAGLGLPLKNARNMFSGSSFNIGYQFGTRGTTDNGLIQENYHIVTIGFTLHDFWFLKAKYD